MDPLVKAKFGQYPPQVRLKMEALRQLIFEVAAETEGVGLLVETLKWGEPAYLTEKPRTGSTLRIDWKPKQPDRYAIYVNCQTTLIDQFNGLFPGVFSFEGSRAISMPLDGELPEAELRVCIQLALTYHRNKRR